MISIIELSYMLASHFCSHTKMEAEELIDQLILSLDNNNPFMAGKIGGFELWAMRAARFGYVKQYERFYEKLCNNAGFFSDNIDIKENLNRFSSVMIDSLKKIDYLTRWEYSKEEFFVRRYCAEGLHDIDWLGVTYRNHPIGKVLEGRKVLVISPFEKTIKNQYSRRELIYEEAILPDFNLITYKSVQTIAGNKDTRFNSWFEALAFMEQEIEKIDFDVALVGCGAYSLPLCAHIKEMSKSSIHMGGELQMLFGIMGKRWEKIPFFAEKRNEFWVSPDQSEIPQNAGTVEDGCYW